VRHDADRAALGVGAKQRALRAFQNLDPIDVEEAALRAARAVKLMQQVGWR